VAMQNTKFGMSKTREEERRMRNDTDNRANRVMNYTANATPPITAASSNDEIRARQAGRVAQQAEVRNMSNEEIAAMARQNGEAVLNAEFASLLSDAQVEALTNSGIFTNNQSNALRTNRDAGIFAELNATLANGQAETDTLNATMDQLNRTISTMSNERLMSMNPALLANSNIASRLTNEQVATLRQSGRFNPAQMGAITGARNAGLQQIVSTGSLANAASPGASDARPGGFQDTQRRALFRNAEQAGRLPINALTDPAALPYLTPRIVTEFMSNNPPVPDQDRLRRALEIYVRAPGRTGNEVNSWRNWSTREHVGIRFGMNIP